MFSSKPKTNSTNNEATSSSINLIGAGTVIDGEIKSNGDIRIDGTVNGAVHSKAKVVVGPTGVVEGDVHCQNADISGAVKGTTHVSDTCFLKATSRIVGDIVTGKFVVEVGANFTGNCNMGQVKEINYADRQKEQPAIRQKTG
ncbi:MAG: polymer-forming cytoskeletal protein [Bacteroidetes bacterium]|nr:polymer-forming cytoskeletal protein [Bacteroidota bacterium]